MRPDDWPSVARIYEDGIATGMATFEAGVPSWEEWDSSHLTHGRLVAMEADTVIGWGALSPVSNRCAYAGVAEVSVYVAPAMAGRGVGTLLLAALVSESEQAGIWTLEARMFPENRASVAIHSRSGFRVVGQRQRLGKLNGRWRDVLLMERRSGVVD